VRLINILTTCDTQEIIEMCILHIEFRLDRHRLGRFMHNLPNLCLSNLCETH